MGILDFDANKTASSNARNRGNQTNAQDRPAAKIWLNIGYEVPFTDEKGEESMRFVNLPVGIPLDTMEALPIRGQNEGFAQLRSAQNDLLKQLQAAGDALEPGAEVDVRLTIKMRKVNEQIEISSESNPLSINVASLIG